jgi:uncharacterized membrane protein
MELSEVLQAHIRWIHIAAGIVWIGLLYFFNFVNAPFAATMDGPTKQKVVPELMPRALYWFRWGAAWTWVTGVLLLLLVFWHGGLMFEPGYGSVGGGIVMVLVAFLAAVVYDALAKSGLGKNLQALAAVGFVLVIVIVLGFVAVGFGYRAYVIHTGTMFGTIMAYNVWMRIWPAQRQIITATKQGAAPDAALVAQAGARSRHNTYLSVPLVWTMINSHTGALFASHTAGLLSLFAAILIGWGLVYLLYSKAATIKGF